MQTFKIFFTLFLYAMSAIYNTETKKETHHHSYTKKTVVSTLKTTLEENPNIVSQRQILESNSTQLK